MVNKAYVTVYACICLGLSVYKISICLCSPSHKHRGSWPSISRIVVMCKEAYD